MMNIRGYGGPNKPYKMPRYDNINGGMPFQNPQPSTSTSSVNPTNNNDDDVWGDDDEDAFLWIATQLAEKQEGICETKNPSPPVPRGLPRTNSLLSCDVTPAESLMLRRQRLENNSRDDFSRILGGRDTAGTEAQEKIEALEQQMRTLQTENQRLKGETSTLRKLSDVMKLEQQEESKKRILADAESKRNTNLAIAEYKREVAGLKLKIQENSQMRLRKSFPAHTSPVVIGTGHNSNSSVVGNTNAYLELSSQQPNILKVEVSKGAATASSIHLEVEKPLTISKEIQTDVSQEPGVVNDKPDEEVVKEKNRVRLENPDLVGRYTPEELREDVYRSIERIVELRYQMVLPTLERIVKEAPKEIMKRLVRGCEIKSAFPDIVDSMFQWGIDKERKRIRSATGITEPTLPKLPMQYEPGIHFHGIKVGIKVRFQIAGAWGALMEVREWLQQVLKSLEGDNRFRMYDPNTLMNFWRLLFWGNELWRCIVFEEENQELTERHKILWAEELQGWTGLVLKCDWRDYFVVDLEVEVRKLTLNILESIVTAGYFEQTKNRYEIMYRIIKDTLTKDMFRDPRNVQHILKIVTWSVSDVMIMKHICYRNNEDNCLARLIGESLLKVCRQESDATTICILYLDYLYLLEALMVKRPISRHHSKIARSGTDNARFGVIESHQAPAQEDMEHDDNAVGDFFFGTQLACPVKYNITTVEVPQNEELSDDDLSCWLDPVKYEDPYGKSNLCQCRKTMMGAAVFVLHSVFEFWRQNYIQFEQKLENWESEEAEEIKYIENYNEASFNESSTIPDAEKRQTRLTFLQDKKAFWEQFLPKIGKSLRNGNSGDSEWNLDDAVRKGHEIPIPTSPLPQWLADYQRQSNVFDLAISRGIFLINFLRTRSENLAAAIGTEAYKEYMVLVPMLRLHMEKLDLNRVDHAMLMSITQECEEDHMSNNSDASSQNQSQYLSSSSRSDGLSPDIEYLVELKHLNDKDIAVIQGLDKNHLPKLQSTPTTTNEEVESIHEELFKLRQLEFRRSPE